MRLEYTNIPGGSSKINIKRYRLLANAPIKVGFDTYFILGGEYNGIDFDNLGVLPFDDDEIRSFHVVDLNLGYIFKWNPSWRFVGIVSPRLASNFVSRGIQGDDFLINLTATLWKEKKNIEKPFRLVLGLAYNSNTGLSFPLPLISYYKRFDPHWSYTLGIPRMNFKHHINEKNTLQTALLLDGYFVNLQNDIVLPDNALASAISLSAVVGAFGYQYNLTKMVSFYGFLGYTINQDGVLRDDKRNNVFLLDDGGNIYFKTGFKLAIF